MFKEIVLGLLLAMGLCGGAQAQPACSPFVAFPLTLNLGSAPTGAGGETPRCTNFKIMTAMNTLPALITANITAIAANATAISGNTAAINNNTTAINGNITATAGAISAIGTLNAKLGAANGIATLGSDGILTAAQRPPGGGSGSTLPYVYAASAGNVVADGTTDQASNIQTAANTCSARGCILVLPCGDIALSTLTLSTQNIVLQSASPFCSVINSLATTGDVLTLTGNYGGIERVGFKQKNGTARTSGYTVNLMGAYQFVRQVHFESCYRCILMAGTAGWTRVEDVDMYGITPDSVAADSGGIQVWNPVYGPTNRIDNVLVYGTQDGNVNNAPLWGVNIKNSGATQISNFDILGFKINLLVNPSTDTSGRTNNPGGSPGNTYQTSQALRVSNGYFDSSLGQATVLFNPNALGYIFDSTFTGVWVVNGAVASSNGIEVNTGASTRTGQDAFKGFTFEAGFVASSRTGGNNGFLCTNGGATSSPSDITIATTLFGGWGQGVNIGCSDGTVVNNRMGPYSPFGGGNGPTNSNGIYLNPGVDNWVVSGNRTKGNAVAQINDQSGAAANIRITDNLGFNGNQPATTVTAGASPYTYTNGHDPATLYVIGGTISSIVAPGGNKTLGGSTSGGQTTPIQLGPNESIVITYTSAPALTRMPH